MQALVRDLRYGMRSLRHRPGLTIVAILALTLGIGLTTMMASIVYGALLKGLPFPGGDRIMIVQRANPTRGITPEPLPIQDYADYKAQQHTFTDLGAFAPRSMFVSGGDQAERFDGSWISANAQSLWTVRSETPRSSAMSTSENPQKKCRSTRGARRWHGPARLAG